LGEFINNPEIAEEEMITVEDREKIRRAYFVENRSIRQIAREYNCARTTVRKAIESAEPAQYTLKKSRRAPVLGPYVERIGQLLAESERMPRKQRYTSRKIYETIQAEGYTGSEVGVRQYISKQRREKKRPQVYIPLEFDPGTDAQVDWGEGVAIIAGEQVTVQLFYMRLCYSRRLFMMAFPAQKQEAFFEGHVRAFQHFQGVPHRLSYDNLKAAVQRVLEGRNRQEQESFVVFRSHYLFESHFCTPGQGHEKGGVEHGVGFGRRNFMVPIPNVASFAELNAHLLTRCLADGQRRVEGQELTIGQAWEREKPCLRPLPGRDFECCVTRPVVLNPYSQVVFETNRYSVPVDKAQRHLVIKAYPFRIDILHLEQVIASHPRCYGRKQDIFDPLHYLPLLEQRPGAFEHARPLRCWRKDWPAVYERLLAHLRAQWPDSRGIREFVRVLKLHRDHPADVVAQAVGLALEYGCAHADGVELCLHQLLNPEPLLPALDLAEQSHLVAIGMQPLDLNCYDQLLERV
jgi:transposase